MLSGRQVAQRPTDKRASTYRADIDGLRAVAILGVVAYHLGLGGVTGGYGGVDVFFVISGFLIAGIINGGLQRETFSIVEFYNRRIRRILPALTVCLLATTFFAALLLFPTDFKNYGRSLVMVAVSLSNFHFQRLTGYFDGAAIGKPLLHTWSLGVEEQFYLVFPLLLASLYRLSRRAVAPMLALIALVSLAYSIHIVENHPELAFFSTPGRAWELLVGVLLAFNIAPLIKTHWVRELEALVGVLLIAFGYFFYTSETDFPGFEALPFCLGAALIIHAGIASRPTLVSRILSSAPAVGLGLISYSVYLWHWPLLVFAHYRFPQLLKAGEKYHIVAALGLLAVSLLIGFLSWRFVEQPYRRRRLMPSRVVFISAAASTALLAGISLIITKKPAWLQRWPSDIVAMTSAGAEKGPVCKTLLADGWPERACLIGDRTQEPDTVLLGDSHAQALRTSLDAYGQRYHHGIVAVTYGGCPPLLGVRLYGRSRSTKCHRMLERAAKKLANTPDIKRIILMARWALYAEGLRADDEGGATIYLTPSDVTNNARVFAELLEKTVKQFAYSGRQVVILGPVPEQPTDITSAVARNRLWNEPLPSAVTLQAFLNRQRHVLPIFQRLSERPDVRVLYPHMTFCRTGVCGYLKDGKTLYRDSNHLNAAGAAELSAIYPEVFNEAPFEKLAVH